MLIVLSVPVWFSAVMFLLLGLVGTFTTSVKPSSRRLCLFMLPGSSGLFYIALRMCGLL